MNAVDNCSGFMGFGRPLMYLTIRRYLSNSPAEITRLVTEGGFISRIKQIPGFVAYYGVETKESLWASVSVFESKEGAEQSDELARAFWQENSLEEVLSAPEITAGGVVLHSSISPLADDVVPEKISLPGALGLCR